MVTGERSLKGKRGRNKLSLWTDWSPPPPSKQDHLAGFPVVGGNWRGIPLNRKIGLSPHAPHTVLTQKCQFCNFHVVFCYSAQIVLHQSTPFGKPCLGHMKIHLPTASVSRLTESSSQTHHQIFLQSRCTW